MMSASSIIPLINSANANVDGSFDANGEHSNDPSSSSHKDSILIQVQWHSN